MQTRREFLGNTLTASLAAGIAANTANATTSNAPAARPNIVLVISDDQGSGDLGCLGHHQLQTPNLDRLHAESVRFTRFYACPVCAPTRASLMTGRYHHRTGVTDTYVGRANMAPSELTLAEALQSGGYATGIFGKWHLGDSYPLRPMDRGFQESLIHKGGGLCQPSDPRNTSYDDAILWHNGEEVLSKGYCTDVFTDAAIDFIKAPRENPFFVYLATNAPHTPLDIAHRYAAPYRAMGAGEEDAKFYGMIANLDENVGRLLDTLDATGQRDNTIFIFLTDNGTAFTRDGRRYNAGLRDGKGSVYEGGIRVPCFLRWPAATLESRDIATCASVIDLMPTLLAASGVEAPRKVAFDGVNLMPEIKGETKLPGRMLFLQWHRGDVPVLHRNTAIVTSRYKLVSGKEFYDLEKDPGETTNVFDENTALATRFKAEGEVWFKDVCATRGFAPVPFAIGSDAEPVTWLTAQDMRGVDGWGPRDLGTWHVEAAHAGAYTFTLHWLPENPPGPGRCILTCDDQEHTTQLPANHHTAQLTNIKLPTGPLRIAARLETNTAPIRPDWIEVTRTA